MKSGGDAIDRVPNTSVGTASAKRAVRDKLAPKK